jgi:putative transposase
MTSSLLISRARNELLRLVLLIDKPLPGGRPRILSSTQLLDKILYICRTGCQWSFLPMECKGSYKTVYHYFRLWSKYRVFEDAFYNLATTYRQQHQYSLIVDSSFVKNVYGRQVCGRNYADRGRKATKVSLLCDAKGIPLTLAFHAGNKNDVVTMRHLLDTAKRKTKLPLSSHSELYADKGYDSRTNREICHRHGLIARIPHRGTVEGWSDTRYMVEVVFGRLDKYRRIIMRYDASICSFKSFHYIACLSQFRD